MSLQKQKELGSIINLSCTLEQLEGLEGYLNSLKSSSMNQDMISDTEIDEIKELLSPSVRQAKLLVQKYDVVITNPPYMTPFLIQKKYVQKIILIQNLIFSQYLLKSVMN